MANSITIEEQVQHVLVDALGLAIDPEDIAMDTSLVEELEYDELDKRDLKDALEEHFMLTLEEDEMESWETVGDIVRTVTIKAGN